MTAVRSAIPAHRTGGTAIGRAPAAWPRRLARGRRDGAGARQPKGTDGPDRRRKSVIPAQAAHRHGRTNRHVMTNEHVGRVLRRAVHRSLRQEQSPRARCGSGAAWGCRTPCRMPLQSFEPAAGRNVLRRFSAKPSKGRGFHNHLARMRSSGCFPATRAMAVKEKSEWSIDLKRDLATYAAPPKCCHSRFSSPGASLAHCLAAILSIEDRRRTAAPQVCRRLGPDSTAETRAAGWSDGPWPCGR